MILKALEMDLVLGHRALGSLPSAKLLPPPIEEDFRGKDWTDLCLKSYVFVILNLGCEICKAPKEQRIFIWSIVCLWPSFETLRLHLSSAPQRSDISLS